MSIANQRQAARVAWAQYVSEVHERHDPRDGWACIEQLPRIGLTDLGLCLRAHPDLLDDIVVDAAALVDSLDTGELDTVREDLAASYLTQLSQEVRRQLLSDLRDLAEDQEGEAASVEASRMGMTHDQYAAFIRGDVR